MIYIIPAIKSLWFEYIPCDNAIDQTREGEVIYGHGENATLRNRHLNHIDYITVRGVRK